MAPPGAKNLLMAKAALSQAGLTEFSLRIAAEFPRFLSALLAFILEDFRKIALTRHAAYDST